MTDSRIADTWVGCADSSTAGDSDYSEAVGSHLNDESWESQTGLLFCPKRAVFFDCGSTLIDPDPSVARMFSLVANRFGYPLTPEQVQPHMRAAFSYYDMRYAKNPSFWASPKHSVGMWYDIYRLLCQLTGITSDVENIADAMYHEYLKPETWAVYDDVRPCLDRLKAQGYCMAVVSNWDPSLPNLLDGLELASYFDTILASAAIRSYKPERHIYETAMDCLGVAPEDCLHVGDRIDADGDAAASAGIAAVIIDRNGHYSPEEASVCGYPVVSDMREVAGLAARKVNAEQRFQRGVSGF